MWLTHYRWKILNALLTFAWYFKGLLLNCVTSKARSEHILRLKNSVSKFYFQFKISPEFLRIDRQRNFSQRDQKIFSIICQIFAIPLLCINHIEDVIQDMASRIKTIKLQLAN